MAALYEFSDKVSCVQAISWSKDNRLALCTDSSVKIFTVSCEIDIRESKTKCHQSVIPTYEHNWDISQYMDSDYRLLLKQLCREDKQALIIDKILNPFRFTTNTLPVTGYCSAVWSPIGVDVLGRCILATLSHDFRLCLYTQGTSLLDWSQICDLSELRQSQTKLEPDMKKPCNFHKYRDWCYGQATVVICWCDAVFRDEQGEYSVLAAASKSGEIVLWKINMPCIKQEDCSVLTVACPHKGHPSCITWVSSSGILVIGYIDGQVHSLHVDMDNPASSPTNTCIHEHSDLMQVSCACSLPCTKKDEYVVVLNKQHFILAYLINSVSGRLTVTAHGHMTGEHLLHGTGMCSISESEALMSSLDGMLQVLQLETKLQDIKMQIRKVNIGLPTETSWTVPGLAVSPHGVLLTCVARPIPGYDHLDRMWKFPTKVHIRCLDDVMGNTRKPEVHAALLLDGKVAMGDLLDVLEVCRQDIISNINTDLYTDTSKQSYMSCRWLQVKRYCLLLKFQIIQAKNKIKKPYSDTTPTGECTKELRADLNSITNTLIALYIQRCVGRIVTSECVIDKEQDLEVLRKMLLFLRDKSAEEGGLQKVEQLDETQNRLTTLVGDGFAHTKCCICATNMKCNDLRWSCENNHTFEVCCKTLQPCDDIDYRTCTVCKAHAFSTERLKEFVWLPGDQNRCTFCSFLLL